MMDTVSEATSRSTPCWLRFRHALAGIYEVETGSQRLKALEGVRGLAVTLVFLFHYHEAFSVYLPADSVPLALSGYVARLGYYGVDLFFALSGFLIYGAIIRQRRSYLGFVGRRLQRIYPTFLVVLCLYLVLSVAFPTRSRLPADGLWTYILQNVLLLPGVWRIRPVIGVAWSLSYEMVFYVTLPLIVAALALRAWWPGARIALALALAVVVLVSGPADSALGQFLMFVPGIVLCEVVFATRPSVTLSTTGEWIAAAVFLTTFPAAVILEAAHLPEGMSGSLPGWRAVLRLLIVGGGFFLMLLFAVGRSGPIARVFSWAPLRWVGNVSYSYYLIHGLTLNGVALVLLGVCPPDLPRLGLFLVMLPVAYALTILTSTGLFLLVERPFSIRSRGA